MARDLSLLPKLRDGLGYLYVEHARIDRDTSAVSIREPDGVTAVPVAALGALLLGPGTTVTHAAVRVLAESGCSVVWVGEAGVRCYAQGTGETRSSRHLQRQVRAWADDRQRMRVVRQMYELRWGEAVPDSLDLQQIRGREGARMRDAYKSLAEATGIEWVGRSYVRDRWDAADLPNRALSAANACLYGICHAAIVSAGYSPALGFIHVGKQLSFVYDVADLYKTELTIPVAFRCAAEGAMGLEGRVRRTLRDAFTERRLLTRIVDDLERLFAEIAVDLADGSGDPYALDEALPGALWNGGGEVSGGRNWSEDEGA